jgi:hypothetical protein
MLLNQVLLFVYSKKQGIIFFNQKIKLAFIVFLFCNSVDQFAILKKFFNFFLFLIYISLNLILNCKRCGCATPVIINYKGNSEQPCCCYKKIVISIKKIIVFTKGQIQVFCFFILFQMASISSKDISLSFIPLFSTASSISVKRLINFLLVSSSEFSASTFKNLT